MVLNTYIHIHNKAEVRLKKDHSVGNLVVLGLVMIYLIISLPFSYLLLEGSPLSHVLSFQD